jgi:hypothetical protein
MPDATCHMPISLGSSPGRSCTRRWPHTSLPAAWTTADPGRLNVPAGGASFVSSPLSRPTRTEETAWRFYGPATRRSLKGVCGACTNAGVCRACRGGALQAPSARHQARGARRAWPRPSVGVRGERRSDPAARLRIRPARRQVDQWQLTLPVGHSHQTGTRPPLHDGCLTGSVDSSNRMSSIGAPSSPRRS